ncbi:hypothetical protein HJG60_009952 [Phyllostomus discolor]|uniref:Uncharacterized protein n=1 Tax=Phyllostomus discolor TaxID=89673 RepID=A0A834B792_9CHIR|nr:hypothetical protein HJG60_009952 [Phyllostomus discolor]
MFMSETANQLQSCHYLKEKTKVPGKTNDGNRLHTLKSVFNFPAQFPPTQKVLKAFGVQGQPGSYQLLGAPTHLAASLLYSQPHSDVSLEWKLAMVGTLTPCNQQPPQSRTGFPWEPVMNAYQCTAARAPGG